MISQGPHAHDHARGHRPPPAARRVCPPVPACLRLKRLHHLPIGWCAAATTEARAPATDSRGRDPSHDASR
jgi:hypothetical protein